VDDLVVNERLVIPDAELTERFSRSSGPGGQGVNTTDSRVELSWNVVASAAVPDDLKPRLLVALRGRLVGGTVTVAASEFRAQLANRNAARERLAKLVRKAVAPPPPKRRPTRPSKGSKERRIAAKKHRGEIKRNRHGPTAE
jgi:ribosome-associated protein